MHPSHTFFQAGDIHNAAVDNAFINLFCIYNQSSKVPGSTHYSIYGCLKRRTTHCGYSPAQQRDVKNIVAFALEFFVGFLGHLSSKIERTHMNKSSSNLSKGIPQLRQLLASLLSLLSRRVSCFSKVCSLHMFLACSHRDKSIPGECGRSRAIFVFAN